MTTHSATRRSVTDRELTAWLAKGAVDRGVGDGLTFLASATSARAGRASWVLRYRLHGRSKEKVLGRYPELSLKDARLKAHADRVQIQNGVDVAAEKQAEKSKVHEAVTVRRLGEIWFDRYIKPRWKDPKPVERALRLHVHPVIGSMAPRDVMPAHIDQVLARTVAAGAPTVANDVLRFMFRMFRMAVRNRWIAVNPAAEFELSDAGGTEQSRERWLQMHELIELAEAMRTTPNFGRENELAVWLLLSLCVRKMELLSAHWDAFDLEAGVWTITKDHTKTKSAIQIPLTAPVLSWLREAKVLACGRPHVFPARRIVRSRMGQPRVNRFSHVSPDTLNVALKRLEGLGIERFTVHDMRRTARTHLARLGISRFVAERSLNHKLKSVEGIYDRHDYFEERRAALGVWSNLLLEVAQGRATVLGRGNQLREPEAAHS